MIQTNKVVADQIRTFVEEQKAKLDQGQFKSIKISQVEFKNGELTLDGMYFTDPAKKSLLNILHVLPDFTEVQEKVEVGDWNNALNILKKAEKDSNFFYKTGSYGSDEQFIMEVKKKDEKTGVLLEPDFISNTVANCIEKCERPYFIEDLKYSDLNNSFVLNLNTDENLIMDKDDAWTVGNSFNWDSFRFNTAPFYKRLVCANGMMGIEHLKRTQVNQKKHNVIKISQIINDAVFNPNEELNTLVVAGARNLMRNNASIEELMQAEHLLKSALKFQYQRVDASQKGDMINNCLETYFDYGPLNSAYGTDVKKKNKHWRSTADSGLGSYDVFNLLTWLGSHQKETNFDAKTQEILQGGAAQLLFKENLDLSNRAPKVENIQMKKIPQMQ